MKTNRNHIVLIALAFILSSCSVETIRVSANDSIITKEISTSNYSAIEIANSFNAYVTFSDTEELVIVESNENLDEFVIAKVKDGKLIVRLMNNINIKGQETLNVYITTKSITDFRVTANSNIYLKNTLTTDNAKIKVTADSFFSGEVEVVDLQLTIEADAKADLYGHANHLDARLSADAKLSDYDFNVDDLKLKMTADCETDITVNNTISIEAIADCRLRYKGDAAAIVHKDLRADSRIIKVE